TTYSLEGSLTNRNLEPESVISSEIGLDISLFHNRIGLEATWYEVEDKGEIMDVQVPTETGFIFASENEGIVRNRGIEVKLYSDPVGSKEVGWDFHLMLAADGRNAMARPDVISTLRFWSRFNAYSEAQAGGEIGDIWGNDVLPVK